MRTEPHIQVEILPPWIIEETLDAPSRRGGDEDRPRPLAPPPFDEPQQVPVREKPGIIIVDI